MSESPERLLTLAGDYAGAGRADPAVEALEKAVALAPGDPAIQERAAELMMTLGRVPEAEWAFRRALELDPDRAGALFGLARLEFARGCPGASLDLVERGRRAHPDDPRGPRMLGRMYLEQGLLAGAISALKHAVSLAPGDPDVRADLGLALQTAGEDEAARVCYLEVMERRPGHDAALRGLARLAELAGDPGEAIPLLAPVVENPTAGAELTAVYGRLLAQTGRRDEAIRLLEQRLAGTLDRAGRMALLFQLGQMLDAAGRPEPAMGCMLEANRLKLAQFEPDEYRSLVDRLLSSFDAEAMAQMPRSGLSDERPVLIVGMPRSGTSLTEQILASHPAVSAGGERSDLGLLALATAGDGLEYPESAARLTAGQLQAMGRHYLETMGQPGTDPVRVTDKMWQNFEYLGLAELMLPGARVIHCVRDPLDCGLSCFFQHFFGSGVAFSYDLGHIGAYMAEYRRIMAHWRSVLTLPIFELGYETLVSEPEATIRALLIFLDLPWDPACLNFHRTRRKVRTASFEQVRRPLYRSSVGRHRPYDRWLGPLVEALEHQN
ncbi:MAG: sulfotransferase [Gammaproteobacteria bacterium]